MKEDELRKYATCGLCQRKIGHASFPTFYRVTLERFIIDPCAIQRQQGLTMMLGGSARLASVMGQDEDMAVPVMDKESFTVCEDCSTNKHHCIAAMAEVATPVQKVIVCAS